MSVLKSELCKSCAHTKVCRKDKNLVGDVFVMGHPSFFDNDELFRKYKEWEAAGFPCDDYMQERKRGKWKETGMDEYWGLWYNCSLCGESIPGKRNFCPNCGAEMERET